MKKDIIFIVSLIIITIIFSLPSKSNMTVFKEEDNTKYIALTFDDGPNRDTTLKLLKALKERNVKVTFFVLGTNISGNEDIIKQINDDGHEIGNHTFSHKNLFLIKDDEIKYEITSTNELIYDITGKYPILFRPSYGNYNAKIASIAQMKIVEWTIDSKDWQLQNKKRIYNEVISHITQNDIVLMHDIYNSSVEAAIEIIDYLLINDYQIVTVSTLMQSMQNMS